MSLVLPHSSPIQLTFQIVDLMFVVGLQVGDMLGVFRS